MREVLVLAARHLLETFRSRGVRILGLVFAAGLAGVWLVLPGAGGDATRTLALFAAVAATGLAAAAAAGARLPADRADGREEWLSSLAPAGAQRRLAAGLAAIAAAALAAGFAGLAVGAASAVGGLEGPLRASERLALPERARLPAADREGRSPPVVLDLPGRAGVLEVETRTLALTREAAGEGGVGRARVAWTVDGRHGESSTMASSPLRIDVPEGSTSATLSNVSAGVHVRLVEARLLGDTRSIAGSAFLAALLVAAASAAVAAVAVAVSRATSAATAAGAALALACLGLLRGHVDDLRPPDAPASAPAGAPASDDFERSAWRFVSAAVKVAPDLGALDALAEPAAGRAVPLSALGAAATWLLYAAGGLALAAAPSPRRRRP